VTGKVYMNIAIQDCKGVRLPHVLKIFDDGLLQRDRPLQRILPRGDLQPVESISFIRQERRGARPIRNLVIRECHFLVVNNDKSLSPGFKKRE
jgi:hypothetical protein